MSLKGRFAYFDKNSHSLLLGDGYYPKPKDDEVLITLSEHASNIIPWFILQKEIGIKVILC